MPFEPAIECLLGQLANAFRAGFGCRLETLAPLGHTP